MSAAAPHPPPPPSAGDYSSADGGPATNRNSGGAPHDSPSSHGSRPSSGQNFQIGDLRSEAQRRIRGLGPVPMKHLIEAGTASLRSAETLLDQDRRNQAHIEYIVAYEIAVDQVPRHRGWPDLRMGRNQVYYMYKDLMDRLQINDERFKSVREAVIEDNRRTRSRPASGVVTPRPQSRSGARGQGIGGTMASAPPGTYNGAADNDGDSSATSSRPAPAVNASSKPKPPIRPKPEALHGNAIPSSHPVASDGASQALAERFARLRGPSGTSSEVSNSSAVNVKLSDEILRAPPADFTTPYASNASSRPAGPRDMPLAPSLGNTLISMPKLPSPAYNPARNMQTPDGVNPPRSTARSTVGTGGRTNMMASNASLKSASSDSEPTPSFARPQSRARDESRRRGSVGLPSLDKSIKADVLYDCLTLYNVLLIDVRSRDEFDTGHIDHTSVICLEPFTLRQSMSAEELQNSLVLSPDFEQMLFDKRDQFDMVVYYDDSTDQTEFLIHSGRNDDEEALRTLFDALWEFNVDRPLKNHPMMLTGGLKSWEALLGKSSLATSDTSATKAFKERKPSRKLVPTPSSQLAINKKRRTEFNPIDAEELRKWEEKARLESLPLDLPPADEEEEFEIEEDLEDDDTSFYRTQADFLRRYPAISTEQESMVQPHRPDLYPPARLPPQPPSYPGPDAEPDFPSRPPPIAPRVSYSGAHERSAAPHNTLARTSSLRPYVPPKDMPQNIRLSKTGLINFGVTCYMNSTIQCLNATLPLTNIFRDGSYRKYIQRDNWKGSKGLLPENYSNLVNHLWRGDVMACRPSTFRNFCARLNREWGLDRQQDAKEFFDFVIDFLHEDMNINWRNPPPHVLSETEEAIREKIHKTFAAQIEWTRYQKRDKSIISDLFAGQHASRLKCLKCGHTSTTYEAFYSISVEIPRQGVGDIHQCLASYCHEERLSAEERWKCPSCKKEREATKQITITRAPRNLVIHFKRFRAGHNESARKVSTPINFPLTNLDLGDFMLAPPTIQDAENTCRVTGETKWREVVAQGTVDESMVGPFRYDAYAVIRHLGSSVASGHYIAVTKDPGRGVWRIFNDDKVQDLDPMAVAPAQRLQNEQAYIVFYQRTF